MPRVRPTLRCLREDLKLAIPPRTVPLDEIDHPLVVKANGQFAGTDAARERIAVIDDLVLFKVKIQRWRGAVWTDQDLMWLVAAGWREDGSGDDFYAALAAEAEAARARYNAQHGAALKTQTYTRAPVARRGRLGPLPRRGHRSSFSPSIPCCSSGSMCCSSWRWPPGRCV